jgi:hypothetical protein
MLLFVFWAVELLNGGLPLPLNCGGSNVMIRVYQRGEPILDDCFAIGYDGHGSFTDLDGHILVDEVISAFIKEEQLHPGGAHIALIFQGNKPSGLVIARALLRIFRCTGPSQELTISIELSSRANES